MTEPKHTPGPWKADGHVIRQQDRSILATMALNEKPWAETTANAKLMAAAPELLEASRSLVEIFDRPDIFLDVEAAIALDAAREAIAAATGAAQAIYGGE